MYVCVCGRVPVHVWVLLCGGGCYHEVFCSHSLSFLLSWGSYLDPEHIYRLGVAGWLAPGIPCPVSRALELQVCHHAYLLGGSWDLNFGLQAFITNALSTKPSTNPKKNL